MNFKISIILPVYNGGKYISKAIESVLAQTFLDWELIIIDDGSTDNTKEVVGDFCEKDSRIKYIKNPQNLGIQKTLNNGLVLAQGKYIARIDADDVWIDTTKLEKQVEFLEKNTDYVLVGTGAILVDEQNQELARYLLPEQDIIIRQKILGRNCFAHSTVVFKKERMYSEEGKYRHVEDQELWLFLGTRGKFTNLDLYSTALMTPENSITSKNRISQAKKMLRLAWEYRKKYKNFIKNYIFALTRFCFFLFISLIPFSRKFLYKIQARAK